MLQKPAPTDYPVHELIQNRWSPLAFAPQAVEPEKILSLLEAARWAPSCFNEQPWVFIVGTQADPGSFERLLSCLVEANVVWAQHAPVLILSVAKLFFQRNGNPNRHAYHDVGLATGNLLFQAEALGLVVHQMAGFEVEKARTVFHVPEGYDPMTLIALGYPGDVEALPENLRARELAPRSRKPFADLGFSGDWGAELKV